MHMQKYDALTDSYLHYYIKVNICKYFENCVCTMAGKMEESDNHNIRWANINVDWGAYALNPPSLIMYVHSISYKEPERSVTRSE